ncbi:hypothetical protein JOB18_022766 [Solea senegalensis]|uniref:Reverse transcriptase domain-containing protein n=1 Tax=Solea senegalensis TaxID=28829 RepID=A0AAV6PPH6_SOLSE|nr:hypothetical protein JOB18_022766 [Solea senegalensis]
MKVLRAASLNINGGRDALKRALVSETFKQKRLEAFGVGGSFLSWVQLLYSEACCVLKVGGGLSRPIPVRRGIRQGCPISGQLYSITIEPLLRRLRSRLGGLVLAELGQSPPVVVSAYADDVNVFIKDQRDAQELESSLSPNERVSSAKVNWGKVGPVCLVAGTLVLFLVFQVISSGGGGA